MNTSTRPLTKEEQKIVPTYFDDPCVSLVDNHFYATWNNHPLKSETAHGPWTLLDLNRTLEPSEVYRSCSNYHRVSNIDFRTLIGRYKGKNIRWHPTNLQWQYINSRPVNFTPTPKPSPTPSEQDKEEVAGTLLLTFQSHSSLQSVITLFMIKNSLPLSVLLLPSAIILRVAPMSLKSGPIMLTSSILRLNSG